MLTDKAGIYTSCSAPHVAEPAFAACWLDAFIIQGVKSHVNVMSSIQANRLQR